MQKVYILIGYERAITSGEPSTFEIKKEKVEPFTDEEIEAEIADDIRWKFPHDYYETKAVYKL